MTLQKGRQTASANFYKRVMNENRNRASGAYTTDSRAVGTVAEDMAVLEKELAFLYMAEPMEGSFLIASGISCR